MRITASVAGILVAVASTVVVVSAPAPVVADPALAAPCRETLASGADQPIPDEGFVTSDLEVLEDGLVVSDVDVTVDVRHAVPQTLTIDLLAFLDDGSLRGGVRLFDRDGPPDGADLVRTVFDDEAPVPISWGTPPFTGRFIPNLPLGTFDGAFEGSYRLTIADPVRGDTGTLDRWAVTLTYERCDFDGDGVEDHRDRCLGVTAATASGCPVVRRSVSAAYDDGRFSGDLVAPARGCVAGRPVSLFRVLRGADRRVGTATTRRDGSYRLGLRRRPGRYYALTPRAVVPGRAECPRTKSAVLRIRRR